MHYSVENCDIEHFSIYFISLKKDEGFSLNEKYNTITATKLVLIYRLKLAPSNIKCHWKYKHFFSNWFNLLLVKRNVFNHL